MSRKSKKARAEALARERRRATLGAVGVVAVIAVGFVSLVDQPPQLAPRRAAVPAPPAPHERVRVEVLNIGGVTGMARSATDVVRTAGFDVVDLGNRTPYDPEHPSQVIDRVGRPELAEAVANALGIDNVLSEPDPNLYVDVSVWVGSAWTDPGPARGAEGSGEHAWWNPKGWLGR